MTGPYGASTRSLVSSRRPPRGGAGPRRLGPPYSRFHNPEGSSPGNSVATCRGPKLDFGVAKKLDGFSRPVRRRAFLLEYKGRRGCRRSAVDVQNAPHPRDKDLFELLYIAVRSKAKTSLKRDTRGETSPVDATAPRNMALAGPRVLRPGDVLRAWILGVFFFVRIRFKLDITVVLWVESWIQNEVLLIRKTQSNEPAPT